MIYSKNAYNIVFYFCKKIIDALFNLLLKFMTPIKRKIYLFLKKNKKVYLIFSICFFLIKTKFFKKKWSKKKYPKVIQLPITYKCNSRCVMCDVWQMDHSNELDVVEFQNVMEDSIFKKVKSVWINWWEPFLIPNIEEYVRSVLSLPKIKHLNIISNGFMTNLILKKLEIIYALCKKQNVSFHVAFSLDWYWKIHDTVRNIPNAFKFVLKTIDSLVATQYKYCDSWDVWCTLTKQNIEHVEELDSFAKQKWYNIKYRLAISNKRIWSDKLLDNFSIIGTPLAQRAKEFFFKKIYEEKWIYRKFRYFSLYYYLLRDKNKRLLGCLWQEDWITLDSKWNIFYCAVESKSLWKIKDNNWKKIFFDRDNLNYRKSILDNKCDSCIHDYEGDILLKNVLPFFLFWYKQIFVYKIMKIKSIFIK